MKISVSVSLIPDRKDSVLMSVKLFLKSSFKKIMRSTLVIRSISFLIFIYSKLVGSTCHWQMIGIDRAKQDVADKNAIWVGWHSRATMMPFFWRKLFTRKMSALVSPHQDGQLIANFLKWSEITPVNGSTNENPRQSALELMRAVRNGDDLFISPDGPRGPRMRMKKSPIYYAQKTGRPIVCACFSLNRALIINNAWDKTMIALPFGKGVFSLSEPLYVPTELSEEEFASYVQKLEDIANKQLAECDKIVGRAPVFPADVNDMRRKKG